MRFISTTIALICLFCASTSYGRQQQNQLLATGNPQAPPIVWSKGDTLQGVGPELVKRILAELNVEYAIKEEGSWPEVLQKVKEGKADLLVSAYKNKDRSQYLSFSEPYIKSPVVMVVKKGDKFRCNSWDDMIGKKGVAGQGESFGDEFDAFIKKSLQVTYTSYQRAFEMLEEDTADYLIIDLYPAIIYSKLLMAEDKIEFIEKPITVQQYHMAFSKNSPFAKYLPEINTNLRKLKADGLINQLAMNQYKKWNATFAERKRFYAQAGQKAKEAQTNYNAGARDRGLNNLARFLDGDTPHMDEPGF